jgi:hypothetical protein
VTSAPALEEVGERRSACHFREEVASGRLRQAHPPPMG